MLPTLQNKASLCRMRKGCLFKLLFAPTTNGIGSQGTVQMLPVLHGSPHRVSICVTHSVLSIAQETVQLSILKGTPSVHQSSTSWCGSASKTDRKARWGLSIVQLGFQGPQSPSTAYSFRELFSV